MFNFSIIFTGNLLFFTLPVTIIFFFNPKLLKGQLEDLSSAVKSTEKNQEQTIQNDEEQLKV